MLGGWGWQSSMLGGWGWQSIGWGGWLRGLRCSVRCSGERGDEQGGEEKESGKAEARRYSSIAPPHGSFSPVIIPKREPLSLEKDGLYQMI